MNRHFLDLDRVPAADLRQILTRSSELKAARVGKPKLFPDNDQPLDGKIVALIFEKPSTRTRISFDVERKPSSRGA